MSKEGSSSAQSQDALFFRGILFHAYYNKLPLIKSQMNLGFAGVTTIHWSENPDIIHEETDLNEKLKSVEAEVQFPMPTIFGERGIFYPFLGYSFLSYSYGSSYESSGDNTSTFNLFLAGIEYNRSINRFFSHNYYFSFTPLMLNSDGNKSYIYYNYGTELNIESWPLAIKLILAFRNGFDNASEFLAREQYTFSHSEIGISFHMNLGS